MVLMMEKNNWIGRKIMRKRELVGVEVIFVHQTEKAVCVRARSWCTRSPRRSSTPAPSFAALGAAHPSPC